ncbi:MAG: replicative DNA helicase [Ruminococcaceae bacterium]|nr:replicative DNA helicase [Oscillospiraceae bacterium]
MAENITRIPPNNIDAEKSVLGAVLVSPDVMMDILDIVKADDFYRKDHEIIFSAMTDLFNLNRPIDVVTVTEKLSQQGVLDKVGGIPYLGSLADEVPLASNAPQYAGIVAEKALQRRLIKCGQDIVKNAFEPEGDVSIVLEKAEQSVLDVMQNRASKAYVQIKDVMPGVFNILEQASKSNGMSGIATGFYDLDQMTAGLHNSDLVIVAGRPAMGKTAFMLNMARNIAVKERQPVAIFNLEMSKEQLATRMLSTESGVESEKLRNGNLGDSDWTQIAEGMSVLSNAPIYFDDSSDISVQSIRSKCRKLKMEKDIKVVFIDYLQLMTNNGGRHNDSRANEVSDMSRALKVMARELNIPVIVGSQVSRGVESRQDKRPMMSDLRESGAIEQDADIIMFLYRDEVYNKETEYKGVAELIIGKHRNGATGTCNLVFDAEHSAFKNMSPMKP